MIASEAYKMIKGLTLKQSAVAAGYSWFQVSLGCSLEDCWKGNAMNGLTELCTSLITS